MCVMKHFNYLVFLHRFKSTNGARLLQNERSYNHSDYTGVMLIEQRANFMSFAGLDCAVLFVSCKHKSICPVINISCRYFFSENDCFRHQLICF